MYEEVCLYDSETKLSTGQSAQGRFGVWDENDSDNTAHLLTHADSGFEHRFSS